MEDSKTNNHPIEWWIICIKLSILAIETINNQTNNSSLIINKETKLKILHSLLNMLAVKNQQGYMTKLNNKTHGIEGFKVAIPTQIMSRLKI